MRSSLLLCLLCATLASAQTPPPIPQAFSSAFTISWSQYTPGPLLVGQVAVNYPKNQTLLYWSDSGPLGQVPYYFETTEIVHAHTPYLSLAYQFLSEGRCWTIGNVSTAELEIFPLEIPPGAQFLRNETIDGATYGIWSRDFNLIILQFTFQIAVRWNDGAVAYIAFISDRYSDLELVIAFQNFNTTPPPDSEFDVPPGPCPLFPFWNTTNTTDSYSPLLDDFSRKSEASLLMQLYKGIIHIRRLTDVLRLLESPILPSPSDHPPRSGAPTPPTLHQYFSANYLLGEGVLEQSNNWQISVNACVGFIAVDKEKNGLYFSANDDAFSNVPFRFSTTAIVNPLTPGSNISTVYTYLAPGRCWNWGEGAYWASPNFPLSIPSNATYNGMADVDGVQCSLWKYVGSLDGYDGTIVFAVSEKDHAIVFVNIVSEGLGTVLKFNKFNPERPPANWYAAPPPPCTHMLGEAYDIEQMVASFL